MQRLLIHEERKPVMGEPGSSGPLLLQVFLYTHELLFCHRFGFFNRAALMMKAHVLPLGFNLMGWHRASTQKALHGFSLAHMNPSLFCQLLRVALGY